MNTSAGEGKGRSTSMSIPWTVRTMPAIRKARPAVPKNFHALLAAPDNRRLAENAPSEPHQPKTWAANAAATNDPLTPATMVPTMPPTRNTSQRRDLTGTPVGFIGTESSGRAREIGSTRVKREHQE